MTEIPLAPETRKLKATMQYYFGMAMALFGVDLQLHTAQDVPPLSALFGILLMAYSFWTSHQVEDVQDEQEPEPQGTGPVDL